MRWRTIIKKGSNLDKILTVIHKKVTIEDYDEVLVISGDEGTGKSRLGLHILEWWRPKIGIISKEELKSYYDDKGMLKIPFKEYHDLLYSKSFNEDKESIKKVVGMDAPEFSLLLKDAKKHDIIVNDEAADISSRSAITKTNKLFMIVYQLIRGENLFTILIIPSIFDLDTFFRKRRVRHLIHVPTRGKYCFWDKQSFRAMVEINEGKPFKNLFRVQPTCRGSFKDYSGKYLPEYLEMKKAKMVKVREMLAEQLNDDESFQEDFNKRVEEQADIMSRKRNITRDLMRKIRIRG